MDDYRPQWVKNARPGGVTMRGHCAMYVKIPCHHGERLVPLGSGVAFWADMAEFYGDPPPAFKAIDKDGTITHHFDERSE